MRLFYSILFCLIVSTVFSQNKIAHTVYFDFNASQLSKQATKELESFLGKIKQLNITELHIEGHADKKGSNSYNNDLSRQRAEVVSSMIKPYLPQNIPAITNYAGEDSLLTTNDEQQAINRRVVIVVTYEEPKKEVTSIEPFYEDVQEQRFSVDLGDTIFITAKEGTTLKIPPGAIQDKNGKLAKGKAEIFIKEYYNPGDILISGLNTVSDKGLLQTGGMFKMVIRRDNDTMAAKMLKQVTIKMPALNDISGAMNVFTINHVSDSSVWNNTGDFFTVNDSYWGWPTEEDKLEDVAYPAFKFENWKSGHKYLYENAVKDKASWHFFNTPMGNGRKAKTATNLIQKIDSVTLRSTLKITYRNKAARRSGIKTFDTTFLVKYFAREYIALANNIDWINCDRFLEYNNKVNFYITTPFFKGANIVIYFKELNAFMPAVKDGKFYKVTEVPEGQKVWIVAFGKKDKEYYFSKREFIVEKNSTADLELSKMPEEQFRKELKAF